MPRGERVGEAYVRIHADGEGMDREIRAMFNDEDGTFEDASRANFKKYRDAWEKEGKDNANQTVLRRALTDALARGDYLEKDFFNGGAWKQFRQSLEKRFDDAGRLAADNLEKGLLEGMDFKTFRGRLDNLTREITNAERQLQAEEGKINQERLQKHRDMLAAYAENERRNTQDMDAEFERHVRDRQNQVDRLKAVYEQYARDVDRLSKGESTGGRSRDELIKGLEDIGQWMKSAGGSTHDFEVELENMRNRLDRIHPFLSRYSAGVENIASTTEKAFGKGARNNFLNFVGSAVGGFIRLANIVPSLAKGFQQVQDIFTKVTGTLSGAGFGPIVSSLGGIASIGLLAAGGIAAVGVAILALGALIGPFVSILGGLLGAAAALASTIGFALVGGLGILAVALSPLAAIVGGVALAFKGLSDQAKQGLKLDLKPLLNDFKGLATAVREPIFSNLGRQAKDLAPVFRGLQPLFHNLGVSISGLGDYFIHALRSPGFSQFRDALEKFLPHAVTLLGQSFGNALGGLGGVFRAAIPQANAFLTWLQKITGEFAKWANSPKGQKELRDFFDKAATSAKALGEFALNLVKDIAKIGDASKTTGDDLFTKMARAAGHLVDYLDTHPDAVGNFFKNADKTATDVGHLVTDLLELADALDTASSRAEGSGLLKALGAITSAAANAFDFVHKLGSLDLGSLGNPNVKIPGIDAIGNALEVVKQKYFAFGDWLRGIGSAIGDFFGKLSSIKAPDIPAPNTAKITGAFLLVVPEIARIMGGIAPVVGNAISAVPGVVGAILNRIPGLAHTVAAEVGNAFSGVSGRVSSLVGGIPGAVQGILSRLGGIASNAANAAGNAFTRVQNVVLGHFNGIPGAVTGVLNRLGGIASSAANAAQNAFSRVQSQVLGHFNGIPGAVSGVLNRLGGIAGNAASAAVSAFARVQGGVMGHFNGIPGAVGGVLSQLAGKAASAASDVVSKFSGLAGRIIATVGHIEFPKPHIPMPDIPHISLPDLTWHIHFSIPSLPHIPGTAVGGMFNAPEMRLIGEAGPEAVVPLARPLSQVDPSVRWLSAVAQGKIRVNSVPSGTNGPGKQYNIDMTVVTPNSDSRAVASEVLHRLTAAGY